MQPDFDSVVLTSWFSITKLTFSCVDDSDARTLGLNAVEISSEEKLRTRILECDDETCYPKDLSRLQKRHSIGS